MISIIIPTHNRLHALLDTVNTLLNISHEASLEIVVVDNNSYDGTAAAIHNLQQRYPDLIRYVHEPRRAACVARNTGARNAHGNILLFLDDDVRVEPGSLARIQQIFDTYANCGMVAAQVLPRFETEPPAWAHACQGSYNGWSLYHPGNRPHLAKGFQEDDYAMGAMHALTRQAFEKAGEYPPDIVIIGEGPLAYRLDIGAGDTGLSYLVRTHGFTIIYDPLVCGCHLVASTRFTPQFWRARMVSEAHYHAVSKRVFWNMRPAQLLLDRKRVQMEFIKAVCALKSRLSAPPPEGGIYPEEMWVH
jgi:glycosyltransferase involved in cell wall biosynthesis